MTTLEYVQPRCAGNREGEGARLLDWIAVRVKSRHGRSVFQGPRIHLFLGRCVRRGTDHLLARRKRGLRTRLVGGQGVINGDPVDDHVALVGDDDRVVDGSGGIKDGRKTGLDHRQARDFWNGGRDGVFIGRRAAVGRRSLSSRCVLDLSGQDICGSHRVAGRTLRRVTGHKRRQVTDHRPDQWVGDRNCVHFDVSGVLDGEGVVDSFTFVDGAVTIAVDGGTDLGQLELGVPRQSQTVLVGGAGRFSARLADAVNRDRVVEFAGFDLFLGKDVSGRTGHRAARDQRGRRTRLVECQRVTQADVLDIDDAGVLDQERVVHRLAGFGETAVIGVVQGPRLGDSKLRERRNVVEERPRLADRT